MGFVPARETIRIHTQAPNAVDRTVEILAGGGLVALPTDTVYGLAAHAFLPKAIARLYQAKGRPQRVPLPLLLSIILSHILNFLGFTIQVLNIRLFGNLCSLIYSTFPFLLLDLRSLCLWTLLYIFSICLNVKVIPTHDFSITTVSFSHLLILNLIYSTVILILTASQFPDVY